MLPSYRALRHGIRCMTARHMLRASLSTSSTSLAHEVAPGPTPLDSSWLLPTFDQPPVSPPLALFKHSDPGLRAASVDRLLGAASKVIETSPYLGHELHGVQLSRLDGGLLDELALLVAERGVVMFRDQDIGADIHKLLDIGRHFSSQLHVHQTYGIPKGYPEIHVLTQNDHAMDMYKSVSTSVRWHSDVTYEINPPSVTFLSILDQPSRSGGDTIWSSQYEAYNRLSPSFQSFLETLTAVHSGKEQGEMARRTGLPLRREPVSTEHPVVRTHPVTGKKALFVNPMFTRSIPQLKVEESDNVLRYLYNHIAIGADFQARFRWYPGTIAVWDNRAVCHTGLVDYKLGVQKRHAVRVTPQGEKPFL